MRVPNKRETLAVHMVRTPWRKETRCQSKTDHKPQPTSHPATGPSANRTRLFPEHARGAQVKGEQVRGPGHCLLGFDALRLHPRHLVRLLDRLDIEQYPYGLLTMIVSLEAIFLSTFVLISQNRADARRQVVADQRWTTVQEEETQNIELLDLSRQILKLTRSALPHTLPNGSRRRSHGHHARTDLARDLPTPPGLAHQRPAKGEDPPRHRQRSTRGVRLLGVMNRDSPTQPHLRSAV